MKKFSWYRKFKSQKEAIELVEDVKRFLVELYDIDIVFLYNKDTCVDGICEFETGKITLYQSIYYYKGEFFTPAEVISKIMHEVSHYIHYRLYPNDPCYKTKPTKMFIRSDYNLEIWCDKNAMKLTSQLFNIKPRGLRTYTHNKLAMLNFLSLFEFEKFYDELPEK